MAIKMLFRKTRDIIVETATIVKGLKEAFAGHVNDNRTDIDGLYKVIKECHETCPESDRFNDYIKDANGTLKRIEEKYDDYHKAAKEAKKAVEKRQDDYLAKLQTIKDEVKGMTQAKKTFRQTMGDIGKFAGYIILIAGFVFGIVRYCEVKKIKEDVKIEKLLKELIKERRVEKEDRG
jgi:hypothetical protein